MRRGAVSVSVLIIDSYRGCGPVGLLLKDLALEATRDPGEEYSTRAELRAAAAPRPSAWGWTRAS